jgi:hypothetical protein
VQEFEQADINTLMILDYGTYPGKPAYEAEDSVWEAYIEKYATRCGQIALHYGDRVQAYQIWNEPDLPHAQPSYNPRVREQILGPLLKAAFEAIKEALSDVGFWRAG